MTCGLSEGAELHFLASGIRVIPYRATIQVNKHELSHARVKLSREAGELVDGYHRKHEPVEIKVDGEVIGRFYIPNQAVNLDGEDAWLKLYDPRKILEHGSINRYYDKISAQDIIEDIYDELEDPYGVITDIRFAQESIRDEISEDFRHTYDILVDDNFELLEKADLWVLRTVNKYTGWLGEEGGFDFEDVSPAEALKMVMDEFEVESWVDHNGVLWLGAPEMDAKLYAAAPGELAVSEYNITELMTQTRGVKIEGPYTVVWQDSRRSMWGLVGASGLNIDDHLRAVGMATIGYSGDIITETIDKNVNSLEALEDIAARTLRRRLFEDRNGNLVINGDLSDPSDEPLQHITIGDLVALVPPPDRECQEKIDEGLFLVTGVTHELHPADGWTVTIRVGQLPNREIRTRSWLFDPTTEVRYSSADDYIEAQKEG